MSHSQLEKTMDIQNVWQEYKVSLERFLRSKVSQEADVEDLLQDILLKTYQNIASLKAKEKLKPWLFQIAHNAIIDFYRRQGRDNGLEEDKYPEMLWYQEDQKISVGLAGFEACISPFVNALPVQSAELLQGVDILGQPQKAYAEALGISYSTLKSRVQKARMELRDLFDACCDLQLDAQGNVMDFVPKSKDCKGC